MVFEDASVLILFRGVGKFVITQKRILRRMRQSSCWFRKFLHVWIIFGSVLKLIFGCVEEEVKNFWFKSFLIGKLLSKLRRDTCFRIITLLQRLIA